MSTSIHHHHHHHNMDEHSHDMHSRSNSKAEDHHEKHTWTVEIEHPHQSPTPLLVSAERAQSYSRSPSTDVTYQHPRHNNVVHLQHETRTSSDEHEQPHLETEHDDSHEQHVSVVSSRPWKRHGRQTTLRARVKFNYIKRQPGELSLHVGEVVDVTDNSDFDWWIGTLPSGKSGMFPSNCCVLETSSMDSGILGGEKGGVSDTRMDRWRKKFRDWVMKQKWNTRMHVFPRTLFYIVICAVCFPFFLHSLFFCDVKVMLFL